MKKSKQLIAMPVISLEEGQQVGTVKKLLINPSQKEVIALIIEQKGWFKEQKFVPFNRISSVGEDIITIDQSTGLEKGSSLPEIMRFFKDQVEIIGAKLITENGAILGYVDEYYLDLSTGSITGLEFTGNIWDNLFKGRAFLDIAFIRRIGKKVIIATSEAPENIFKLEGGIQRGVENLIESTSLLLKSSIQKTRSLSNSLNIPKIFQKLPFRKGSQSLPETKENIEIPSDLNETPEPERPPSDVKP